jgi:hypothetical protein
MVNGDTRTEKTLSLAGKRGHAGQLEDDACGQHDGGREMGDHGFVSTKQKASSRREDVAAAGVETISGARSFAIRLD